ncbi:UvrD-helicase domain-containing protein [Nanoarchaeota archaeon]
MGDMDYLNILKAIREIPFSIGKKLLVEFLQGNETHDSIRRNKMYDYQTFGSMGYERDEIESMIDNLMLNGLLQLSRMQGKFWQVLEVTDKGKKELEEPKLYKRKVSYAFKEEKTEITEKDREVFKAFGEFLEKYNDEQKKAIITTGKEVLCIAGAGSGKTTVLTKRIEFLVKYRSVDASKILAITFTRKARQEMQSRLSHVYGAKVETFNSFCEKILRRNADEVYDRPMRVVTYRDKIRMINQALAVQGIDMERAIDVYFTMQQRRMKTDEQLMHVFMNDCFFIRDYFKFKNKELDETLFDCEDRKYQRMAKLVFGVVNFIQAYMKKHGLRDFADQLMDALGLFDRRPDLVPEFDHVLVDEYQDVNSTQIKLLEVLNGKNLFCVGDPRQSIYGWRGSDIKYILKFGEKYPQSEIVTLTKNYRSVKPIVELFNDSIKSMKLPDLEGVFDGERRISTLKFDGESAEQEFIVQAILASPLSRREMFVLARTNRQLNELSLVLKQRGIAHLVKTEDINREDEATEGQVTLATVHAIKGMEAEMVFVMGCTTNNFPCRASEHPVVDLVKADEYDKEEEERRLFYVAISRAKKMLYMTHVGKVTSFITPSMKNLIDGVTESLKQGTKYSLSKSSDMFKKLKDWRTEQAKKHKVAPFMIMHDRVLIDLADKRPMTKGELENISGMGPVKVQRWGEELLKLVQ